MTIRSYQPGDEEVQVAIYNEVAAELPKFKAATVEETRRRCKAREFDPTTRWYVEDGGQVVGYMNFHLNGRVSFPWLRKSHAHLAGSLFQHVIAQMRQRGLKTAFAAYRADWPEQSAFFQNHGFRLVREMVNFVLDLPDMPTPAAVPGARPTPLVREDLPTMLELLPGVLRLHTAADLEQYFFNNPYFGREVLFTLRSRDDDRPLAIGLLIDNPHFADPKQVDAMMPCYRLGAFGTEGMQTKRIHGMFSFLARPDRDFTRLGIDLMGHAATRLEDSDAESLAAQVPSDVPHLLRFYQQFFRRQGAFPVFERNL